MDGLRNFAAQVGTRRMLAMAAVAAVLLIVMGTIALRGPSPEMGYLYTDLDPAGAQSITQKLTAQSIPFQISADGTAVMAPRERLAELRMSMASEQLGGKIGYEVLDQEEPFGVSSSRAKMNETRAIEGELSRSIESLDRVTKARVHIVMPEHAMFAAEARKATAAITLKTQGALDAQSIKAIRYLVSASVPELSPDSVSIVDQTGALLARAGEASGDGGSDIEERQAAIEAKLRTHIEQLVEPVVGQGKVRVEVAAVIDREQTREEANVFDPDKQVRQITKRAARTIGDLAASHPRFAVMAGHEPPRRPQPKWSAQPSLAPTAPIPAVSILPELDQPHNRLTKVLEAQPVVASNVVDFAERRIATLDEAAASADQAMSHTLTLGGKRSRA